MLKPLEKLLNLLLALIAFYAITAAIVPVFGYQLFIFPIKFEVIQNISFDYVRLLLLRSCVFLTMAVFILNYALYKRPYSALAPVAVFCYSLSIFEFLAQFTIAQITDYSISTSGIVFFLTLAILAHYKNSKSAKLLFKK